MKGEIVTVDGVEVDNVLVEDGLAKDVEHVDTLSGARVAYTLRFPTDANPPAHDAKVTVRGEVLDVLNVPDHWDCSNVFDSWSNPWDMNVLVGKTLGDFTATIAIVSVTATINQLGDPAKTETTVYSGTAQARMKAASESAGTALETDATETWCFIVPWNSDIAALRPASTFIDYANARYDVRKIDAINNKQEFVLLEAVRHG